ncbi:hypothetical protein Aaci_2801 [Alicyclobacillus acidocaldarius subsp. acidocaldarius DSM 446]|uniref:Uncharacterized protein n=1 Tax=Alicyclobacillus acidocaldarius subsp. acidocaldarius (strain ATCC 27009 / DSM 446 / BCRC 14685 / JCM 5260 / KCTC 1825 / NBRC 15652 / NCIMB 11725 / NRRL B-14509 / 104-IA) TaxID=521098 RepID=C8WUI9_ALIAD|nr:hypothetical protein Aaci_2801 [Alicyclobacillus acidocaldarius subsp. acidocaldarius DSM 446]
MRNRWISWFTRYFSFAVNIALTVNLLFFVGPGPLWIRVRDHAWMVALLWLVNRRSVYRAFPQLVGIRDEPASDSRAQAGHEPPQSNDPQT